jgi:hypothetical protein
MSMIQNKIYTIIGHKGYGKTALSEKLLIGIDKPTIICDPRMQYEYNPRRIMFKSVEEFQAFITKEYRAFKKYKFELVVNVVTDEDFKTLGELVYKMKQVCFLVDEIDMFFDVRANKDNIMNKLVQYGRHNQIDIVTTSRRPANISRNLTALTDIFLFSRLREPNDKKYIKALLGNEYVETIADLEKFSFLEVEDYSKNIIKKTKNDIKNI